MNAVFRLGAGKEKAAAAESLCRPHRIQGVLHASLLDPCVFSGTVSGSAPSHMEKHITVFFHPVNQVTQIS